MMEQDVKAQHTPSDAAKRKACELANAQGHAFMLDRVGRYFPEPKPGFLRENAAVYALALYLDEVDRVARELRDRFFSAQYPPELEALMLPDPVDPLEEIFDGFAQMVIAKPGVFAATIRAELDKRGYKLVKENPDAK